MKKTLTWIAGETCQLAVIITGVSNIARVDLTLRKKNSFPFKVFSTADGSLVRLSEGNYTALLSDQDSYTAHEGTLQMEVEAPAIGIKKSEPGDQYYILPATTSRGKGTPVYPTSSVNAILEFDFTPIAPTLNVQTERFIRGESAFEAFVRLTGFTGTESEWINLYSSPAPMTKLIQEGSDGDTVNTGFPGVYTGVFVGEDLTENPGVRLQPISNNPTQMYLDTNGTVQTGLLYLYPLTQTNVFMLLGNRHGFVILHGKDCIVTAKYLGGGNRPDPSVRVKYLDTNRLTLHLPEDVNRRVSGFLQLTEWKDTGRQKVLTIPAGSLSGYVIESPWGQAPVFGRFIDASNTESEDVFLVHNGTDYIMQTELPTFSGKILLIKL
jgi:hypothetical protein